MNNFYNFDIIYSKSKYSQITPYLVFCAVLTSSLRGFSLLHHLYTHHICLFHSLSLIDCLVDDVFKLLEVLGCLIRRYWEFQFIFDNLIHFLSLPDLLMVYFTQILSVIFMWFENWREWYFIYHILNLRVEYRNIIHTYVWFLRKV